MGRFRGLRNDGMRKIVKTARDQGWSVTVDGSGHVRVTNPSTGAWFVVSGSSAGGAMGHTYLNTRTQARKAGLDVTKL